MKTKFHWSSECENAFNCLKNKLMNPPILAYPDFSKQFLITVDASNGAYGFVLSQKKNGQDFPIFFASRTFTKGECNKPIIEKELLAVYYAI